ncbi:SDR family oxidoreductase [Tianweitania populi]|uniref:3-ketoacyl-ACP reductase n=1 Tax=Tianweitania populi TaxID=1607949 RepID=A0A8J3DWR4_9HYPH|nr:SDR family oxidoreductase [Tianweitania populi]GHD13903.1 3-ketoacyl-ACP reductase [Tianweitania populi]
MSDRNDITGGSSASAGVVSRRKLLAAAAAAPAFAAVVASGAAAQVPSGGSNKVALVTGSSRGIGAATAKRLARDGYKVMVNCVVNRDLAAEVVRDIEAADGQAAWEQADVSDPRAVARLFEATDKAFGGVDVVVNNAGIMNLAPFAQMSDDDFNRMIDVNLKGGFFVLREAAKRVRDGGRIISLSSSIIELRSPTYGPYTATKGANSYYSNILAKELAGRQISVNAVAPGLVNTTLFTDGKTPEMIDGFVQRTPHKRLGEPEDIANVIGTLCEGDGAWINGQTIFANGGVV